MSFLDDYSSVNAVEGVAFTRSGMSATDKRVNVSKDSYAQLYEQYINESHDIDKRHNTIIEHTKSIRTLRIEVNGDLRDDLKDDEDIYSFYKVIANGHASREVCGVFMSDYSMCFHFPFAVYKPNKYKSIAKTLMDNLEKTFDAFDIENEVVIVGVDGSYPVILTERVENSHQCTFEYFLPDRGSLSSAGSYGLSVFNHTIIENCNHEFSSNQETLAPLLFSPMYKKIESMSTMSSVDRMSHADSSSILNDLDRPSIDIDQWVEHSNETENPLEQRPIITNQAITDIQESLEEDIIMATETMFVPGRAHNIVDLNTNDIQSKYDPETFNMEAIMSDPNHANLAKEMEKSTEYKAQKIIEHASVEMSQHLDMDTDDMRGPASFLLPLISKKRFHNHSSWLEIGAAIKNTYDVDLREAVSMWVLYSHKAGVNMEYKELEKVWSEIKPNYSILTIAHYAKLDDRATYETWYTRWVHTTMMEAVTQRTDMLIAKFIYRMCWLDYIRINGRWYTMSKHKCCLVEIQPGWIANYIMKELCKASYKWQIQVGMYKTLQDMKDDASDTNLRDFYINLIAFIRVIQGANSIRSVTTLCNTFFESKIEKKFDCDINKTAWINGVTVATDRGITIEHPKLEDYMKKCTNSSIANSTDTPAYRKLVQYMEEVFPEGLDKAFITDLAGLLRGTPEKKLKILSGMTNNSKSCILRLLEYTLGNYYHTCDIAVFMGKGEGASPQLASAENCRLIAINDPDPKSTLGMSLVKQLTGGDPIYVRLLHENGGAIDPTFRIYIACNALPKLSNADVAGAGRFLVFPFLATWVEDVNDPLYAKEKYIRAQDPDFNTTLREMVPAFARMLVDNYNAYLDDLAPKTRYNHPLILKETKRQWSIVNPFLKMFKHHFEKNTEGAFSMRDVMSAFNGENPDDKNTNEEWYEHQLHHMGIAKDEDGDFIGYNKIRV